MEKPDGARTRWNAPEIDGSVIVDEALLVCEFADISIYDWWGYDLVPAR